jgi:hypothetical protein
MGLSTAMDIRDTDATLEQQIAWHLTSNHFPPIPLTMVDVCIRAIDAYNEDNAHKVIGLPEGVGYKGLTVAPAWAIIEQHHLDVWVDSDYEDED